MISGPTATCICQENEYAWDVEATLRKIRMFSPPMNLYFKEKRKIEPRNHSWYVPHSAQLFRRIKVMASVPQEERFKKGGNCCGRSDRESLEINEDNHPAICTATSRTLLESALLNTKLSNDIITSTVLQNTYLPVLN